MDKEIKKYHLPLLTTIPVVWIVILFLGSASLELQPGDTKFVMSKIHIAVFFTLILGVKAYLYYATRAYPLSPPMSWFDIGLTVLLTAILVHFTSFGYFEKSMSGNTKAFLSLGIGVWMMMQFFMGLNYFLVMFTQAKGNGKSLF